MFYRNFFKNQSVMMKHFFKLSFMHTKRFYTFFKRWVQFRVVAIPCLPFYHHNETSEIVHFYINWLPLKHILYTKQKATEFCT